MARLSDRKTLSNEEIEASVEELSRKLEILRVRYEQYFIGVEKVAPSVMRMEVVRLMRDLEQLKIKNTAIKFKLRTVVQKFTSYSTYWNRTLREIEDGTYKRHVDKAKREAERLKKAGAQPSASRQNAAQTPNDNRSSQTLAKDVANEADDFLASLGYAPTPNRQNAAMNSQNVQSQMHHPVSNSIQAQSGAPTPEPPATAQQALRRRRPAIVGAQTSAPQPPTQQTAIAAQQPMPAPPKPVMSQPPAPPKPALSKPAMSQPPAPPKPALSKPAMSQPHLPPATPTLSPRAPVGRPAQTPPLQAPVAQPSTHQAPAARPAVPNRAPSLPPTPAAQQPHLPQATPQQPATGLPSLRPAVPNRVPVRTGLPSMHRPGLPTKDK